MLQHLSRSTILYTCNLPIAQCSQICAFVHNFLATSGWYFTNLVDVDRVLTEILSFERCKSAQIFLYNLRNAAKCLFSRYNRHRNSREQAPQNLAILLTILLRRLSNLRNVQKMKMCESDARIIIWLRLVSIRQNAPKPYHLSNTCRW